MSATETSATVCVTLLVLTVVPTAARAQDQPRSVCAVRAAAPPVIDGKLDDACWKQVRPVTGFTQIGSAGPAAVQSVGYVMYDDRHLYVGVRCAEPDVKQLRYRKRPHDDTIFSDDVVEIMVDPGRRLSQYYQFVVNPAGSTFDAFRTIGGSLVDQDWDGLWRTKAHVGTNFWSVEVAIQFACLGLTPGLAPTWGLNICREKMRPVELSSAAPGGRFNQPVHFLRLTGLKTDLRRYAFQIGPATTAVGRVKGRLCAMPAVPVVNRTGQAQTVRVCWDGQQAAAQLPQGGSYTVRLDPVPLTAADRTDRLEPSQPLKRVRVEVRDPKTNEVLALSRLRPPTVVAGLSLDVGPLYARQALSQPADHVEFNVRLALDEPTRRGGSLTVRLVPAGGDRPAASAVVRPCAASNRVRFPRAAIPWGGYVLEATFRTQQGETLFSARAKVPVMPRGRERVRVLNNLVTELRHVTEAGERAHKQFAFMNPRDGWVFFSSRAGGKGTVKLAGDDRALAVHDGGAAPVEAMRRLPLGRHTVTVEAGDGFALAELIVRAIPELQYCNYPTPPLVAGFGPYDRKFLAKHVLPNCNVIVGAPTKETADLMRDWTGQGKRWIMRSNVPGVHKLKTDVDSVFKYWSTHPGFAHPLMSGAVADEFGGGHLELYANWTAALRRIGADPRFAGRTFYPYCGSLHGYREARPFVETVLANGWALAWERYLTERPTEQEAREFIDKRLVQEARAWSGVFPGCIRQMVVVVGYFDTPWCSLNVHPTVNFLTYVDMQFRTFATDPAYWGLYGFQTYLSYFCDAETVHWGGKLYRHYCIEGKTEPLARDPYKLTHLANPDFDEGTKHWVVEPAEPGSIQPKHMVGLSILQMRYPRTSQGNHFLWTKRSAKRPNRFSQTIRDLVPGRLYSLKLYSADYQDLVAGRTVKKPNAVSIAIEGAQIVPKQSFQSPYHSCSRIPAGKFTRGKLAWLNYHWRVFRATAATGTLTITDWADPAKPGGPIGQELAINFVELQPYTDQP